MKPLWKEWLFGVGSKDTAQSPQPLKVLTNAILTAKKDKQPLQLQFRDGKLYKTITLPYYDGMRYPSLQRVDGTPDRLDDIFAPSKSPLPAM